MKNFALVLFLTAVATGCNGKVESIAQPQLNPPPQTRQGATTKVAKGDCTDAVLKDLSLQFVTEDQMPAQGCELLAIENTDPANPGDTHHYIGTLKCDGEYVPFYIFNVQQGPGADGTVECRLNSYDIPPTVAAAPSDPTDWTIDRFISELESNQYGTIEQALLSLPESVRTSFTLLYEGHGLRGTTKELPGAILFSDEGKYAITFGDESQRLGNELEIYRFDFKTNKGELVRAAFPAETTLARAPGVTGVTVEKNPTQCLGCHQSDPMMRWGSYSTWKGVYGGDDDLIDPKATDDVTVGFLNFMKNRGNLPRYRTLIPVKGETGILPFWDDSPVSPYTSLSKDGREVLRPNAHLNSVITLVDARRLARRMMESPAYKANRSKLLIAMLGCDPDFTNFGAALKDLGLSSIDLQPNLLDPPKDGVLPEYSDGFSSYGPGRNSVVDYAADIVYRDLLVDHPELAGSLEEQSAADTLSPNYWVFGNYPVTVRMFTQLQQLGSFLSSKADGAQSSAETMKKFCTKIGSI